MLTETPAAPGGNGVVPELLGRMIAARQLTETDARSYLAKNSGADALTEERVLRWLAREYGVGFAALDELEPDKQVLSLFPARLLLRDQLLPLRRVENEIEIATSRLFATHGLDGLKALTGLRLRPVLATAEVIDREMKKRLGVGADTIDTLDERGRFAGRRRERQHRQQSRRGRRGRVDHPLRQSGLEGCDRAPRVRRPS